MEKSNAEKIDDLFFKSSDYSQSKSQIGDSIISENSADPSKEDTQAISLDSINEGVNNSSFEDEDTKNSSNEDTDFLAVLDRKLKEKSPEDEEKKIRIFISELIAEAEELEKRIDQEMKEEREIRKYIRLVNEAIRYDLQIENEMAAEGEWNDMHEKLIAGEKLKEKIEKNMETVQGAIKLFKRPPQNIESHKHTPYAVSVLYAFRDVIYLSVVLLTFLAALSVYDMTQWTFLASESTTPGFKKEEKKKGTKEEKIPTLKTPNNKKPAAKDGEKKEGSKEEKKEIKPKKQSKEQEEQKYDINKELEKNAIKINNLLKALKEKLKKLDKSESYADKRDKEIILEANEKIKYNEKKIGDWRSSMSNDSADEKYKAHARKEIERLEIEIEEYKRAKEKAQKRMIKRQEKTE